MLTLAKTWTDSCNQYCNKIYTVTCKRVAKVKIRPIKNLDQCKKSQKSRVKYGTTATTTQCAIGLDQQNNNFARAGFGELKPSPHS